MEKRRVHTSNTRTIPDSAKNGIALPVLRVDSVDYNLEDLDRSELIELAALIKADIDNIEYQRESGHTGSWADPQWEARSMYAQRMKSTQVQLIQAELGRRKEAVKPLSYFFQERAWSSLAEDVFRGIMDMAKIDYKTALATT